MSGISNVENLSPQIIRQVSKELGDLTSRPPEGIKVFMNDEDITDIQAVIDGPAGTPYAGGYFRMKLVLGKKFPSEPPKAYFLTKIFHPNVAPNGEICVNTLKKDWKAELGLKHILLTIKCLLIVPNPESALNEEAGKLLLGQYTDYSLRAKMFTEIHAKPPKVAAGDLVTVTDDKFNEGPMAKKHAGDKKLLAKKKKDKKKVLKRL
ncbi:ubiquitin-conjugating enzyme E2 S-like [Gigantopelta aegis]|uniref:ubiquitin-conjugating enzyme E2 S-like n=1 Tax=Gigantopelta aegis TaxID=1735272 RepID=UPI001B888CAA|nr:ubiquitin-conjugating enzyme E2 S-like [Gigantopelta aegis]